MGGGGWLRSRTRKSGNHCVSFLRLGDDSANLLFKSGFLGFGLQGLMLREWGLHCKFDSFSSCSGNALGEMVHDSLTNPFARSFSFWACGLGFTVQGFSSKKIALKTTCSLHRNPHGGLRK